MLQGLFLDCRHALCLYRKTPVQSVLAVLVVAVGVAVSVSFFSLYSTLALQAMPGVADDSRLVSVGTTDGKVFNPSGKPNAELIDAVEARASQLSAIAGAINAKRPVSVDDSESEATIAAVSPGYFSGLALPLALGRGLDEADHADTAPVVVLSHDYWQAVFDGDEDVLERRIRIADTDFRVIGVAAPGFSGFHRSVPAELFMPTTSFVTEVFGAPLRVKDVLPLRAIGHLAPGATPESADRELAQLSDALREEFSDALRGVQLEALAQLADNPYPLRDAEKRLAWFVAAAALLLLVAATNLSLFFLARAPGRRAELKLRQSLGATPLRLFRQLLTETTLLVLAGTLLGVIAALWLAVALQGLPLFEGVDWGQVGLLDWRVALFSLALAGLLSLACAVGPHWSLRRSTERLVVHRSARPGYLQQAVTMVQIVIATVVLGIGVLFTQVALTGMVQSPSFATDDLTVLEVTVRGDNFRPSRDSTEAFRSAIRHQLLQVDTNARVAFSDAIPMARSPNREQVVVTDGREPEIRSQVVRVDAAWFETLDVTLRHGRADELADPGVATVNTRFAEAAWGHTDVVGQTIALPDGGPVTTNESSGDSTYRVVAVSESIRYGHPALDPEPAVYLGQPHLLAQLDPVYVRSSLGGDALAEILRPVLSEGGVPMDIQRHYPLAEAWRNATAPDRVRSLMTTAAAALVVTLALMGFFGTLRFMVEAGRFEFALRAAVGASPDRVFGHVVQRALAIALPGFLIGAVAGLMALDATLNYFALAAARPAVAMTSAILLMAALLAVAIIIPARRAARLQPGPLLRED